MKRIVSVIAVLFVLFQLKGQENNQFDYSDKSEPVFRQSEPLVKIW